MRPAGENAHKRLIDFLRNDLRLTGTKEGCGRGHCGSCAVLIDGKLRRACRITVGQAAGRHVLSIEGLGTPEHPHPIQRAFMEAGAVQCGFCTPGMIMATKALLDANPHPSRGEIARALRGHLCRCTGYVKIIDAVLLAADYLMGAVNTPVPPGVQGEGSVVRLDALAKVTGTAVYGADLVLPGTVHVKAVRSPHPYARILEIDAAPALQLPGVIAVFTARDVPGINRYKRQREDQPVLAEDVVRFCGEPVALVVAETEAAAERGVQVVRVDYQVLPPLLDPAASLAAGAPSLHPGGNILAEERLERGDVQPALAQADLLIRETYRTTFNEHAYLEPEAGTAYLDEEGRIVVYGPTQAPHHDQREIAKVLGLPAEKVRMRQCVVGGGFGGKIDMSVQCFVGLVTHLLWRPSRMVYTREESFLATTKRHPFTITCTTGCTREGLITALEMDILADTGAYASAGPGVLTRAVLTATGPYRIPNVRVHGRSVYTNNPIAGAMRGYGVPQVAFALESQIDMMAQRLGLDPIDLRRRNGLEGGDATATGQVLGRDVGYQATLEAVKNYWTRPLSREGAPRILRGRGVASMWYGIGRTNSSNICEAEIVLTTGGQIRVYAGATEMGQGCGTVLGQIAARALGQDLGRVTVVTGDSLLTPDADTTSASRQTYMSGMAVVAAARELEQELLQRASRVLDVEAGALVLADGAVVAGSDRRVRVDLATLAQGGELRRRGRYQSTATRRSEASDATIPYEVYSFGTEMTEVAVDTETGQVTVERVVAAHDCGHPVNPQTAEGQVEGGILMGVGFALKERFVPGSTENFRSYHIPTAGEVPEIISLFVTGPEPCGPFGAKGLGECSSIAMAPAIANAIFAACGYRPRELPVSRNELKEFMASKPLSYYI
ncbi:hypothetical protein SY88_16685 [Clostridiales bacterium PH28_bin88]|nr:hypothetical protein SY88_16685 [Clostridiales bacterium PH28_bin88]